MLLFMVQSAGNRGYLKVGIKQKKQRKRKDKGKLIDLWEHRATGFETVQAIQSPTRDL